MPALVVGSHLDTVRNAGRYYGPLDVVSGIAWVEALARESVRFGATLTGRRGVAVSGGR